MPMGNTSYFERSIASSTLPAPIRETACSELLPPKTTATRIRDRDSRTSFMMPESTVSGGQNGLSAARRTCGTQRVERLGDVHDEVVGVLEPDREPHGSRVDPGKRLVG